MVVTLYGSETSPPVRGVRMACKALGIEYDFKKVNVFAGDLQKPEYLKANKSAPHHTHSCGWRLHPLGKPCHRDVPRRQGRQRRLVPQGHQEEGHPAAAPALQQLHHLHEVQGLRGAHLLPRRPECAAGTDPEAAGRPGPAGAHHPRGGLARRRPPHHRGLLLRRQRCHHRGRTPRTDPEAQSGCLAAAV